MWLVAIFDAISLLYVCISGNHLVLIFLMSNNFIFVRLAVGITFLYWFLNICSYWIPALFFHMVLNFILGAVLLISGYTHIFPLVSPGISFFCRSRGIMHPFWKCCCWKEVFLWLFLQFWCWYLPKNVWGFLLPQVLLCVVCHYGVFNWKLFDHMWCPYFCIFVFCHVPGKILCRWLLLFL